MLNSTPCYALFRRHREKPNQTKTFADEKKNQPCPATSPKRVRSHAPGKQTQPPRTRCYCPHYRAKPSARIPQHFSLALVKSQSPPSIQTEAPTTRAKPNKRRFRLRPRRVENYAVRRQRHSSMTFFSGTFAAATVNGRDCRFVVFEVNVAVPSRRRGRNG